MTEKLFWNDCYTQGFDAKVTSVSGNRVILTRQPSILEEGGSYQPSVSHSTTTTEIC